MIKERHQRILFGSLFNGYDKPLKFIPVMEEQIQAMLKRRHESNPYKAEPLESVLGDIEKRRKEFVISDSPKFEPGGYRRSRVVSLGGAQVNH